MHAVVLARSRGQKDDRHAGQRRVLPQPPAQIQPIAAGHHDVQQKQRRPLPLRVLQNRTNRRIRPHRVARALQLILHQPADVGIVFQGKDHLTHSSLQSRQRTRFRA